MLFPKFRIDIHSKKRGIAGRLSNFTRRDFEFDGIHCRSVEGFLQSLKYEDTNIQRVICGLWGVQAKLAGEGADWKTDQTLYWCGRSYKRESKDYHDLIKRMYTELYLSDAELRRDIKKSRRYRLIHSIGNNDPKDTVLTEKEFIGMLEYLAKDLTV